MLNRLQKAAMGEMLVTHSVLSALAREVLLGLGSEAFIRAEAQSLRYVQTSILPGVDLKKADADVQAYALARIQEIFVNADNQTTPAT